MRIVYLLSFFELLGGQEYYLARQQARQGHEVFVVTSDRWSLLSNIPERYRMEGFGPEELERKPGRVVRDGMTIIRLPTIFAYQDFTLVRGVRGVLEELRPDVVFGHEPRTITPALGARYKDRLGYVYFLDSHDFFHKVQNHVWWQRFLRYAEYFWWRRFFVDAALRKADKIIAVAPQCKTFLHKRHGIPLECIDELPLGVDTDFFSFDADARTRTRAEIGAAASDIVLLFAGYMFRRKALESLIDLVASVRDLPLRIVFAGEGPTDYISELRTQSQKMGVRERVHFTGFVSRRRVSDFCSAADIGIWPGNNSLVTLEAMACRLPIIMADLQLKHLALHGNGFIVPYADTTAMEKRVRELATNTDLRKQFGNNSYRAVVEHYSYAKLAQQVSDWMQVALAARRS